MLRERLEVLPFESLKSLAEKEGIDVPDDVAKVLLVDLILEVFEENRLEREMSNNNLIRVEQKKFDITPQNALEEVACEDIPIPGAYAQTRIVLLVRDPYWAFAYWDVKNGIGKAARKEGNGDSNLLRVLRLAPAREGESCQDVLDRFDISVHPSDRCWYINIPYQDTWYCVDLVCRAKHGETVLGRSNIVKIPRVIASDDLNASAVDPLLGLSGLSELGLAGPAARLPHRINSRNDESPVV